MVIIQEMVTLQLRQEVHRNAAGAYLWDLKQSTLQMVNLRSHLIDTTTTENKNIAKQKEITVGA